VREELASISIQQNTELKSELEEVLIYVRIRRKFSDDDDEDDDENESLFCLAKYRRCRSILHNTLSSEFPLSPEAPTALLPARIFQFL
jgi:hypothetical protein